MPGQNTQSNKKYEYVYRIVSERHKRVSGEAAPAYPVRPQRTDAVSSFTVKGPHQNNIELISNKSGGVDFKKNASDLLLGNYQKYNEFLQNEVAMQTLKAFCQIENCFFVSTYKNTKMDFLSVFCDNKKDNIKECLYREIIEEGSKQFNLFLDYPSGILEFSKALDNRIPLQINFSCEDEEDNGAWRFYVVLRNKNRIDVLDLRYLCCQILPETEFSNFIKAIRWKNKKKNKNKKEKFNKKSMEEKTNEMIKGISVFIAEQCQNGFSAVIAAPNIRVAEAAEKEWSFSNDANSTCDPYWFTKVKVVIPEDGEKKQKEYMPVLFPMSEKTNRERLLHLLFFDFFVCKLFNNMNKCFSGNSSGWHPTQYGLFIPEFPNTNPVSSGVIVSTSLRFPMSKIRFVKQVITPAFRPLYIASFIESNKLGNLKSAVGSIMSRNGSHNIGSHVLSALSHQIGTMPDDRTFYQYIQQRMGYIANVTTSFPRWTTSTMFVGDMMRTFFSQHHLLEYIADSEGLRAYCFRDPDGKTCADDGQSGTIKLYVRKVDRDNNAVTSFISYGETGKSLPIPFKEDVPLAIPGGIVGQHAFFTILENIIRNAAKHGWAKKRQSVRDADDAQCREAGTDGNADNDNPKNLEIHISFETKKDRDTIEFTIWDNVSDVFSPLYREKESESVIDKDKLLEFLNALSLVNKSIPLEDPETNKPDGSRITRKDWCAKQIRNILGDDPSNTQSNGDFWGKIKNDRLFDSFVRNRLTEDEMKKLRSIDFKSCVPLHMQQEILLDREFIDENGELQRENWGMSEMRISAGYLRNFSIEQIGGLNKIDQSDFVIRAIAVKEQYSCPMNKKCDSLCSDVAEDCPNRNDESSNRGFCPKWKKYHLGYRFMIRENREMLIVLNAEAANDVWKRIGYLSSVFKKEGVYFAAIQNGMLVWPPSGSASDNEKNKRQKTIRDFNYDYVIFPTENDAKTIVSKLVHLEEPHRWMSYYPFRLLFGEIANGQDDDMQAKPVTISYEDIVAALKEFPENKPENNQEKKKEDKPENDPEIQTKVFSLKNIVYRDWLKPLKARFLPEDKPISMLVKTDDNEKSVNYLFQDFDLYRFIFRTFWNHVFSTERKSFPEDMWKNGGPDAGNQDARFRFNPEKIDWEKVKGSPSPGGAIRKIIGAIIGDIPDKKEKETEQEKEKREKHRHFQCVLGEAMRAYYEICDSLLRGRNYCVTLPDAYKDDTRSTNNISADPNGNLGLDDCLVLLTKESEKIQPVIRYQRHLVATSEYPDCFYAEQLSGIQPSFNTLRNHVCTRKPGDAASFVRLAENALLRVLIIDERVSKFLTEHPGMRTVFFNINIFVADISEIKDKTKESFGVKEEVFDVDLGRLPLFPGYPRKKDTKGGDRKWDILIIHQGVIDKWFSRHSKAEVGKLIDNLQNRATYPVITSGRGRPENIPDYIKVLPFSTIESTLFSSCPEKTLLTATIMNLLPHK